MNAFSLVRNHPFILLAVVVLVVALVGGARYTGLSEGYSKGRNETVIEYQEREKEYLKALADHQREIQSKGDEVAERYRELEHEQVEARKTTDSLLSQLREAQKVRGGRGVGVACPTLSDAVRLRQHISSNSGLPEAGTTRKVTQADDALTVIRDTAESYGSEGLRCNELREKVKLFTD